MKNILLNYEQINEIRTKTNLYFGLNAITKIDDIAKQLKNMDIDSVLVVSSKSAYKKTGAWDYITDALNKYNIKYSLYDKVTPNPTNKQVDEAKELGLENKAKAVIGIGGGSPIDTAKSAAILLKYPEKTANDLYEFKFIPSEAVPIIAINTTHGTGTEINRFAVVSIPEKEYKPAIAYDCIYPLYSIDDPNLMLKLPKHQTLFVTIDALNHVIEAATTKIENPYAIMLAKQTIELIYNFLPECLKDLNNPETRYYLLYASALAGISFDNGLLHFTHALEHPLSAVKPELAHGLGLAMILPAVIEAIYPAKAIILANILKPIVPTLKGTPEEATIAAAGVEKWLAEMGLPQKLLDEGFSEKDIDKLTNLAINTPSLDLLLSMAPINADINTISRIYSRSLKTID